MVAFPQSRLLRGDFREYSLERLFRLLTALGRDIDIDIVIRQPRSATGDQIAFISASEFTLTKSVAEKVGIIEGDAWGLVIELKHYSGYADRTLVEWLDKSMNSEKPKIFHHRRWKRDIQ